MSEPGDQAPRGCAFVDCGRPECQVCALGRIPQGQWTAPRLGRGLEQYDHLLERAPVSASVEDQVKARAVAVPTKPAPRSTVMPKRRYRVGPHR
jgi:hypothetical protein